VTWLTSLRQRNAPGARRGHGTARPFSIRGAGNRGRMQTTDLAPLLTTPGPFATVFVDVSQDSENGRHERDLRVREACERLAEQGADQGVLDAVKARLDEDVDRPAPAARLVVAAPTGVVYDETAATRIDRPVATWGPLPDLGDWVAHRDAAVSFVLALVDHEGGAVTLHDTDVPEPELEVQAGGEERFVHKVPTGGWAALRYQHTTQDVWRRNADAVVEEVDRLVMQGNRLVLLGGDPASVSLVRGSLPQGPGSKATLVELPTGSRAEDGGDEALQEAIRQALIDQVVQRRTAIVHRLREALGQGRGAVTGVRDVADAFVKGQVETLLLDVQALAEHRLDPANHPGLQFGSAEVSGEVRADQALIAAAVLTDAEVAPLPSAALGGAPVAALLRWTD
jgi:hypothetical protein